MIPDIYFEDNYGKLYEKIEKGVSQVYYFEDDFGKIKTQFIKREIPIKIKGDNYFDIVTPYGYGGPIIMECEEGKREKLLSAFNDSFKKYCKENNIVSEFIR